MRAYDFFTYFLLPEINRFLIFNFYVFVKYYVNLGFKYRHGLEYQINLF